MAWIRLDDQIAHHPKFLKAGPIGGWLWVNCLGFAQKFLTNGFIPSESLPTLGTVKEPQKWAERLVKIGLLDKVDGGYQIHDYLEFNESADVVKERKKQDRLRKQATRIPAGIHTESERNPDASRARVPSHPIPSHPSQLKNSVVSKVSSSLTSNNGTSKNVAPIDRIAKRIDHEERNRRRKPFR